MSDFIKIGGTMEETYSFPVALHLRECRKNDELLPVFTKLLSKAFSNDDYYCIDDKLKDRLYEFYFYIDKVTIFTMPSGRLDVIDFKDVDNENVYWLCYGLSSHNDSIRVNICGNTDYLGVSSNTGDATLFPIYYKGKLLLDYDGDYGKVHLYCGKKVTRHNISFLIDLRTGNFNMYYFNFKVGNGEYIKRERWISNLNFKGTAIEDKLLAPDIIDMDGCLMLGDVAYRLLGGNSDRGKSYLFPSHIEKVVLRFVRLAKCRVVFPPNLKTLDLVGRAFMYVDDLSILRDTTFIFSKKTSLSAFELISIFIFDIGNPKNKCKDALEVGELLREKGMNIEFY